MKGHLRKVIVEEIIIIEENFRRKKYELALITVINNSKYIIMDLSIPANQFSVGVLGVIDADTQAQVTATIANAAFTSSDETVFTATQDSADPNSVDVAGVAAGEGTLSVTASVTYTDSKTQQLVTASLTLSVAVTVTAVVTAENVELAITFGTPQHQ